MEVLDVALELARSRFLVQTDKAYYEIQVADPINRVVIVSGDKFKQRFHTRMPRITVGESTRGETVLSIKRMQDA